MSCCGNDGEAETNSKAINKQLTHERKNISRTVKLLLLGSGDSGKSTIAKQMKIIHLAGFTEDERKSFRPIIANNVLTSIRTLIHQAVRFNKPLSSANGDKAQKILDIPREDPVLTRELGEYIQSLWQDPAIKETFARSSEYQLGDSTAYYFENIARLSAPDYIPIEADVLRSRVKTTGVLETAFQVADILFRLVDVGGQRSERRKWIHCFEEVTAIIFCVAISEYDLKLYEDNETNRLRESMLLFKELCSTHWFKTTAFILFLNKTDIFDEKISRVPLSVCFPSYIPPPQDVDVREHGRLFVREQFTALNENGKMLYTHYTCATDTENINVVFNAVRDIILSGTLVRIGVL